MKFGGATTKLPKTYSNQRSPINFTIPLACRGITIPDPRQLKDAKGQKRLPLPLKKFPHIPIISVRREVLIGDHLSRVSLLALWPYRGFHKSGYPQMDGLGWFIVEKPIKMDDLGVPQFQETSICFHIFPSLLTTEHHHFQHRCQPCGLHWLHDRCFWPAGESNWP